MRNTLLPILAAMLLPMTGLALAMAGDEPNYPRANLLVEPDELAKPAVATKCTVLDAGSEEHYKEGHIPGALWIDHDAWKAAFGDGQDVEAWSARIGKLGIRPGSKVVVYDDLGQKNAGRMWWILRYWGVRDVRLLNGGWKAWTAAELPTTDEPTPAPEPAQFKAKPRSARLATLEQMLRAVETKRWQIVDARTEAEFCGADKHGNLRAGAMPGAKHLDWTELVDPQTHRFKPAQEMRRLFDEAGIDLGRPTATHCQSGGRASVMAFGLELLGAKKVRNYYKSWKEWGNSETTPIVAREQAKEEKPKETEKDDGETSEKKEP